MKAEILTIGDEILIGQIVNTNSVWIARELNLIGISVVHMASVSDEASAIISAFEAAAKRADIVFITGGLGPTKDDITKKTFATFFDAELVVDEGVLSEISSYFTKRGRAVTDVNRDQALVPSGSIVIRNAHGTAPGMWMEKNGTIFVSMPGVPYEMEGMMKDVILPRLKRDFKLPFICHRTVLTQGIGESALAAMIEVWEDELPKKGIKLAYLPQTGMVKLRLSAIGNDKAALEKMMDTEVEMLAKLTNKYIFGFEKYGEESPGLEKVTSQLLLERGETISLAESCTGGHISSLFTSIPGASNIFKGAIVPYTNAAKHQLLSVDEAIFEKWGAVSSQCVEALAKNVRTRFDSTYSIAVSGIAGPTGGTPEKPVGTVWIAVSSAERTISRKYQFGDHRQRNIVGTGLAALNLLRKFMLGQEDNL